MPPDGKMGWPRVEVSVRSLDDEIEALRKLANGYPVPGKSPIRGRALSALRALLWIRDGAVKPSEALSPQDRADPN